ncbi:LysR family transcriptional regulator substrate-binding protein [Burkholderia sp. BKH01]|nr:LysR family transcriptional regulator substrate-binding protein [Burkholderia sp. BKH01]MCU9953987.1 LysR family transcriptional regulator substrate-binding protein [Burkholderia sp. BKH01]
MPASKSGGGGGEGTNLDMQLALVRGGIGACVISALAASHSGPLGPRYRLIESPALQREVYVFTRRDVSLLPAAVRFLDILTDALPTIDFVDGVQLAPESSKSDLSTLPPETRNGAQVSTTHLKTIKVVPRVDTHAAMRRMAKGLPAVVVLERCLPDVDGLEVQARMISSTSPCWRMNSLPGSHR